MFRFLALGMCLFSLIPEKVFALSALEKEAPPYGWTRLERATSEDRVDFKIYLRISNEDKLTELADGVSSPGSPLYRQHRSISEVHELIRPPSEDFEEVRKWLLSAGISERLCVADWDSYKCKNVPVFLAEYLLSVNIYRYRHSSVQPRGILLTEDEIKLPNKVSLITGVSIYNPITSEEEPREEKISIENPIDRYVKNFFDGNSCVSTKTCTFPTMPGNAPAVLSFRYSEGYGTFLVSPSCYKENTFPTGARELARLEGKPELLSYPVCPGWLGYKKIVYAILITMRYGDESDSMGFNPSEDACKKQDLNSIIEKSQRSRILCIFKAPLTLSLDQNYFFSSTTYFRDLSYFKDCGNQYCIEDFPHYTSDEGSFVSANGVKLTYKLNSEKYPNWVRDKFQLPPFSEICEVASPVAQGILEPSAGGSSLNSPNFTADWEIFRSTYLPLLPKDCVPTLVSTGNPGVAGVPSEHAVMVLMMMMSMSPHSQTVFWDYGTSLPFGMIGFLDNVTSLTPVLGVNTPKIWSISSGILYDARYERVYKAIDRRLKILTAIGTSVFVSSGNDGVFGRGKSVAGTVQFPKCSPYITVVGGLGYDIINKFSAASIQTSDGLTSGGGFCGSHAETPAYQIPVINQYVDRFPSKRREGRGYPDLSMIAVNLVFVYNKTQNIASGTSLSTPIMAGIFSLLNSQMKINGKPLLGNINRLLYEYKIPFYDIVLGNNFAGGFDEGVYSDQNYSYIYLQYDENKGYEATNGWDPVTGFGAIMYNDSLNSLLNNSPYYLGAALNDTTNQANRYIRLNSSLVLDSFTSLIWNLNPSSNKPLSPYCGDPTRIPTLFELMTLLDYSKGNSLNPINVIFGNVSGRFWTQSGETVSFTFPEFPNENSNNQAQYRCVQGRMLKPSTALVSFSTNVLMDQITGLLWDKNPFVVPPTCSGLATACQTANSNKRTPTLKEMMSIYNFGSQSNPLASGIDWQAIKNTNKNFITSTTASIGGSEYVYYLDILKGTVKNGPCEDLEHAAVLCVYN
ncbi:MAG: S8 family serine peptidase [Myxococcaceae bacterium]|nr:S8 family serine peptidase [Myxococcaceae bacterium]MBH2005869.1 S8 family serine peptidase [Myxococcaceae bacterium]